MCENQKPIQASNFFAKKYYMPNDSGYRTDSGILSISYLCSESDANAAGYERS